MPEGFKLLDAFIEVHGDGKKAAEEAAADVEKSPESEKAGTSFGKKLAVGIGGALVAAGIGAKLSDAMDIQAGQAKLTASLDLTKSQSAAAGKAAGSLYSNNYGDSMDDVQESVGQAIGAISGLKDANANTVADITKKLINIRTAFGVDVGESAQAAGELVKNGMAKNASEGADLLTAGFAKVPESLRGTLLDSVNEYSPYFKMVGASGSQMFDTLIAASKGGDIQIDKAGDAIKEFGIRVTDLTDTNAGPALKRLGLSQKAMADDMLAGGSRGKEAMQKIVSGLQAVKDPAEQAKDTAALFGTQIEDIGKGKIPGFLAGLQSTSRENTKVAGSADKLDKTLNNTAKNTMASVQRGFQGWTNDLVQNSGVLGGFVGVAGTIGPTMITSGAGIATMAGVLGKMGIITKIAAAGQWLLNAAMSANPIGIVIVLIAAIVAALIWFFTQTKVGKDILAGFFSWVRAVVGALATWWDGVWKGISAIAKAVWSAIVGFVTAYINTVKSIISFALTVIRVAWTTAWNAVATLAKNVWNGIVSYITNYINTIKLIISTGIRIAQAAWSTAVNTISSVTRSIFSGIVGFVRGVIGNVVSVVSGIEGKIKGIFAGAGTWLLDVGRSIVQGLANGIRNAIGVATGAISGVLGAVKNFLPHSPAKTGPFSGSGWTAVGGAGEAIVGEVAAGFNRAADSTDLAMPKLKTSGAVTGVGAASSLFGGNGSSSSSVTGDTIQATLQVNMDDVSDVAKLVAVMKALPQAARAQSAAMVAR